VPSESEFLNDPRIQLFGQKIAQAVGSSVSEIIHHAVRQIEQNISPAGRPVEVLRLSRNGQNIKKQTTTPQLLAELNDNIKELTEAIREANELVREQSYVRERRR